MSIDKEWREAFDHLSAAMTERAKRDRQLEHDAWVDEALRRFREEHLNCSCSVGHESPRTD